MYNAETGAFGYRTVMEDLDDVLSMADRLDSDIVDYSSRYSMLGDNALCLDFVHIGGSVLFAYAELEGVEMATLDELIPADFSTDLDLYLSGEHDDVERFHRLPPARGPLRIQPGMSTYRFHTVDGAGAGDSFPEGEPEYFEVFTDFTGLQGRGEQDETVNRILDAEVETGGKGVIYEGEHVTVTVPSLEALEATAPRLEGKESQHIDLARKLEQLG